MPSGPECVIVGQDNHKCIVMWSGVDHVNLAGYNVYRSYTLVGKYTKLNSSIITDTWYVDDGITNGVLFYYLVTAKNNCGVESTHNYTHTGVAHLSGPVGDLDHDSLPDDWEVCFFGNTWSEDFQGDRDHDNLINLQEYLRGETHNPCPDINLVVVNRALGTNNKDRTYVLAGCEPNNADTDRDGESDYLDSNPTEPVFLHGVYNIPTMTEWGVIFTIIAISFFMILALRKRKVSL